MTQTDQVAVVATEDEDEDAPSADAPEDVEELLVEEISIDGLCGVY
ncbi:MAG TPA: mycofactocin precursor MftA [Acidimicrobiales bacterium]|nr:mycofactocin precursor MftA [Acidimicrobiales bacterium]